MTDDAEFDRDTELSRLLSFAIFIAFVVIPAAVAVVRLLYIGVQNASLFGVPSAQAIDPGTDPTLWMTAILLTIAAASIAALVAIEAWHKRVLISGIVLAALSAIVAGINWFIVTG